MSVSFTGAVKYEGFSLSTWVLHETARDQAFPCAHHQAKIIDGAKKPQLGTRTRICDGQSEGARVTRFDMEKISDLDIEYDTVSKSRHRPVLLVPKLLV